MSDQATPSDSTFDAKVLDDWLRRTIGGLIGPMRLSRIQGGQSNPTFFVDFDNVSMVLRKQPPGELLPSAHAVDREARVLQALAKTDVPVPEVMAVSEDRAIVGTPFYVMRKLEGRVFALTALPQISVEERKAYYQAMAETLATLHAVDWAAVGLADYGKPQQYFERQVKRWAQQWQASKGRDNPDVDQLIEWLSSNVPSDDTTTIAHGDYRMGNLMFHASEPRVIGILDWELSTLGHPMADLAYACIPWHMAPEDFDGMRGLDLASLGIPPQSDFVAHYQRASGRHLTLQPFHLAFSMFRLAVILEGIAARVRGGNAAGADAAAVGARASAFARQGVVVLTRGTVDP